jgi:hypothetical protein
MEISACISQCPIEPEQQITDKVIGQDTITTPNSKQLTWPTHQADSHLEGWLECIE